MHRSCTYTYKRREKDIARKHGALWHQSDNHGMTLQSDQHPTYRCSHQLEYSGWAFSSAAWPWRFHVHRYSASLHSQWLHRRRFSFRAIQVPSSSCQAASATGQGTMPNQPCHSVSHWAERSRKTPSFCPQTSGYEINTVRCRVFKYRANSCRVLTAEHGQCERQLSIGHTARLHH